MRIRLNEIKQREQFRPIAPVCMLDEAERWFDSNGESPYMLFTYRTTTDALAAATHVNRTACIQTVTFRSNKSLCDLLAAFKVRTGYGVLCNTSLNFKGKGFINNIVDLDVYTREHGLDGFVVEGRAYLLKASTYYQNYLKTATAGLSQAGRGVVSSLRSSKVAGARRSMQKVDGETDAMDSYPLGFEEDDCLRSAFIRELTLRQLRRSKESSALDLSEPPCIPKTLIQYWHDPSDVPDDVLACINSWDRLREEGFEFRLFDDVSATSYIATTYGRRQCEAFARCYHPAMRSDYLRMCFVLAEGGLYVDADDVLVGDDWNRVFRGGGLKVQPLCYDVPSGTMVSATKIWQADLPTEGRIFYVNNDPMAAPAGHPVLRRALARATERLLGRERFPEIQSTTGPGNFTAALAAHARELRIAGALCDFELLRDWEAIAETRWELSYRDDARNWRNVDAGRYRDPTAS